MKNQRKLGVLLSYIAQFVQILSGIFYTPVMLRLLGQSQYGLYTLVASVTSYLSLLSFGFSSSYIRFYSRIRQTEDETAVARFNGMFLSVFLLMMTVCLFCGFGMVWNIRAIFGDGLSGSEYAVASVLMIIMVINLALMFPNSVFNAITSAHERFIFQKLLTVFQALLNPFLTLPLLLLGYGSIAMVVVSTALTVARLIVNIIFCLKVLRVGFSFSNPDFSLLKEMGVFTSFIFINLIVDQVNWNVDKYLLGRFSGTVAVAVYGVGAQLNTHYISLSTSVSNVFAPEVNRIVATSDDNHALTALFIKVGRVQFMLLALVLSGFVFFGKPFIHYWAGDKYDISYLVGVILMAPSIVPLIQNTGIEIQRAKNKHQVRSLVYLFIAVFNVLLSIPLIYYYGAAGAAAGTAVALIAGNIIFMNWYYHVHLGIDVIAFWRSIAQFIPALIPSFLCAFALTKINLYSHILIWLVACILYALVYLFFIWRLGMNQQEKQMFSAILKRFYHRKNA